MSIIFTLYVENFIFFFLLYRLSLVIIQICHLPAGGKLLGIQDVKISLTTINDHLKHENTVITRELLSVIN